MKFREITSKSGKKILAGKDDESNEELVNLYLRKANMILHTAKPGSPFCVIEGKASKQDIKEAGVFCAKYSQAWKKASRKADVEVHVFSGKDVYKCKGMKTGTFGVKKHKKIIVKKSEVEG